MMMMAPKKLVSTIAHAVQYAATKPPERPIDKSLGLSLDELRVRYGSFEAAVREARRELGLNTAEYNIAVAGARGVGKSSLINALLSLDPNQGGAPVVGRSAGGGGGGGGEGELPKAYRNAQAFNPLIVMWELPGAGVGQPADTYFLRNKLYAYDHILLVSDRFTRVDFQVAKAALELARLLGTTPSPLTFVRTKADVALARMLESPTVAAQLLAAAAAKDDHVGTPTRRHVVEEAIRRLQADVRASWQEGIRLAGLTADQANGWELYIVSCEEFKADADVYMRLRPNIEVADPSKYIDQPSSSQEADDLDDEPLKADEDSLYLFLSTAPRRRLRRALSARRINRP